MTEHRIATLAMRIFALYLASRGLGDAAQVIAFALSSVEFNFILATSLTSTLLFIGLGVLVWVRAQRFAARALPDAERSVTVGSDISTRTVLNVALVAMGIFLLATAITQAAPAMALWIEAASEPGFELQARRETYRAIGYFLAGGVLLLGARGLSTFFQRSWWTGGPTQPEPDVIEVEVDEPHDDR